MKLRKKSVPKYLDEEGDFILSYFRTCEGNGGTILSLYISVRGGGPGAVCMYVC